MDIGQAINKSLFFLGAGASKKAGCKLSSQMLDDLKDKIVAVTDGTFNRTEREALKFLFSCLEYHNHWRSLETSRQFLFPPNIEELALLIRRIKNREQFIPYPITGNWADKLVFLESEFKKENDKESLFESLENKIRRGLLPHWLKDNQPLNYLQPLKDFFAANPSKDLRLDIFSLNNDIVIEKYFTENNSRPWRGFVSGEWRGVDDPPNANEFNRINLYKLHGSIDWVRLTDGSIKEEARLAEIENENIEHEHYVIFGQGTKTFSVEPFFSLVQKFKSALAEKEYFFVLGYSFFDPYINNFFIDAIRGTSKKIIVVNPTFGPTNLCGAGEEAFHGKYFEVKFNDSKSYRDLSEYINDIQRNSFYSEMPEFNIKQINPIALKYLPLKFETFLARYFSDSARLLVALLDEFEKERQLDFKF